MNTFFCITALALCSTFVLVAASVPANAANAAEATPADWVLIATKTYDADATKPWLDHLLADHTRVAIIQNGKISEVIALDPRRIVPVSYKEALLSD